MQSVTSIRVIRITCLFPGTVKALGLFMSETAPRRRKTEDDGIGNGSVGRADVHNKQNSKESE